MVNPNKPYSIISPYVISIPTPIGKIGIVKTTKGYLLALEASKADADAFRLLENDTKSLPIITPEEVAGLPRLVMEEGFVENEKGERQDIGAFVADIYGTMTNLVPKQQAYEAKRDAHAPGVKKLLKKFERRAKMANGTIVVTVTLGTGAVLFATQGAYATGLAIATAFLGAYFLTKSVPAVVARSIQSEVSNLENITTELGKNLSDIQMDNLKIETCLKTLTGVVVAAEQAYRHQQMQPPPINLN